jgi:hypothetical protein
VVKGRGMGKDGLGPLGLDAGPRIVRREVRLVGIRPRGKELRKEKLFLIFGI